MNRGILLTCLFFFCFIADQKINAKEITITTAGKTQYRIVQSSQATEPEKYAARELAEFLKRVSGASFSIIAESSAKGKTLGIYVGWTKFASRNGINSSKLGEEEWVIRTVGNNLIITGGRPRGTMYGVYEFLEDQVGCHWLDRKTEVIPSKSTLQINKLNIQAKPWFWQRWVHSPTGTPDDKWKFMVRNKNYRYDLKGCNKYTPEGAFYLLNGYPRKPHSFSYFVNASKWFKSHPEYFSLALNGKRIPAYGGHGPGQLCLTNPDVLRLTLESLRKFIQKDRKEAKKKGCPPPKIYWINQNDRYDTHCYCKKCQAVVKREGGESGPLLEYINAVAKAIEKDYPDILVGTLAYNKTAKPPKNVRPRKNVLVGWCDVYSRCDGIRPLKDLKNSNNYAEITSWGKITSHLAIGDDYWTAVSYYPIFPTPYSNIACITSDIKLFADQGAESFFAEAAEYLETGGHFIPLRFWLAYQLLVDPHQPVEPLIKTFMDGYYGDASDSMQQYLKYMRKRIDKEAQYQMLRNAPHKLKYLDLDFFVTSEKIFDKAMSSVKPNSLYTRHIQVERFILDGALLFLWPWLEHKLTQDEAMPFDYDKVIERYKKEWIVFTRSRYSNFFSQGKLSVNSDGRLLDKMVKLFKNPQIPEKFKKISSRNIADFNWLTFSTVRPAQKIIPDSDAAGGMAAQFTEVSAIQKAEKGGGEAQLNKKQQHKQALTFGVTKGQTITIKAKDIPQNEKYNLYKIGRIRVKPGTMIWALPGKRLGVCVDRVFDSNAEFPSENDWNTYISLKVQGPRYVKGSKKPDAVYMDRVLLVRPQKNEKLDKAYLEQLEKEKKRILMRPKTTVSRISGANGDPLKVNWDKVPDCGKFKKFKGKAIPRDVSAKLAHDNRYLYVCLAEKGKVSRLFSANDIWSGDDWEILFAPQRGLKPYHQIGINPKGKFVELAYGAGKWRSNVKVISQKGKAFWKVLLAFPLNDLLPGTRIRSGEKLYINIMRGGRRPLVWSPIFREGFHSLERLGEVILK